ncbi:hypothetical protein K439DRAFT_804941 [Ramaria rubella]|nr:hypothetical protein K439DRAFT_804941 [Ramaria rubella]
MYHKWTRRVREHPKETMVSYSSTFVHSQHTTTGIIASIPLFCACIPILVSLHYHALRIIIFWLSPRIFPSHVYSLCSPFTSRNTQLTICYSLLQFGC